MKIVANTKKTNLPGVPKIFPRISIVKLKKKRI
jgi:hypothetical protein